MNAVEKLNQQREINYIVGSHYLDEAAKQSPALRCQLALPSLQRLPLQESRYFDREGAVVPLWVAVTKIDVDAGKIFFHYATEVEIKDGKYVPKPPKVGTVRHPWDITIGLEPGGTTFHCFDHLYFQFNIHSHNGMVFFQIISETPVDRKGKHTWVDAFAVEPAQAVSDARRQFHSANIGRNNDGKGE